MQRLTRQLSNLLASDTFFIAIVVLLVFQASWYALSGQYPLAFDENFHFGIIKLYSEQWSPFFTSTPPDSGAYGALVRDPSYLYHYLMSFPHRLIAQLTDNEIYQIVSLRFINIAMFAAGLYFFRRLLLKLGITRKLTNFSLLMLIFVPAVPFLAAHINYDNLLFLLVPTTISLAITCARTLKQDSRLPVVPFLTLIILSLLTSLVKYVYLPIFMAVVLYLLVVFWNTTDKKEALVQFFGEFKQLRPPVIAGLIVGLLLSVGLFIERDIGNLITYHTPSPSCDQVESVEHCLNYGPWARDYKYVQFVQSGEWSEPQAKPLDYIVSWFAGLLYRLYFAINYDYSNKPPLPIPFGIAAGVGILGSLFFLVWGRRIIRQNPSLVLPLLALIVYAVALFYMTYTAYLSHGVKVAVNGRYFIPFLPFIFVFVGLAFYRFLSLIKYPWRKYVKVALATVSVLAIIQGGGLLTFIVKSDKDWYWQNDTVIDINQTTRRVASPLIIGAG